MKIRTFLLAMVVGIATTGTAEAAVKLLVDQNGKLQGATGVMVEGKSYDVAFADGTCTSLFNACSGNNFDFNTKVSALSAGQALLDQVLVDGPDGNFDTNPDRVAGITLDSGSEFYIPYASSFSGETNFVSLIVAINTPPTDRRGDVVVDFSNMNAFYLDIDTTGNKAAAFARFFLNEPVSAVPEPATWAMMLAGFGMIAGASRYRRRNTATTYA